MKNKKYSITLILLLSISCHCLAQKQKETLKIYLPREITIEDNHPTLGQISILRGNDTLIEEVSNIGFGHLATPEHTIIVDRNTVLSRLACNGISASQITLTGSEQTIVKQKHQLIKGDVLAEKALAFLKNNLPDPSICEINSIDTPDDLILPNISENIKFICQLGHNNSQNQQEVLISVFQDETEVGKYKVLFRFKFQSRKAIA